jgi:competence protein ComEA
VRAALSVRQSFPSRAGSDTHVEYSARHAGLASGAMERLLPWLRRSAWAYLLLALALGLAAWRLWDGGGSPAQPERPPQARFLGRRELLVHVAGEVRRPGVYRIAGDGRVIQALRLAGGPTSRADLAALNLAAPLQDGQRVLVPTRAPPAGPAAGALPRAGPVSLSAATAAQLEALDGVGPALAARIVAWRDAHGGFSSVDQLLDVPGIGDGRLEALRPQVVP